LHLKLVVPSDDPDPEEVWPGVADVNRAGLALAVEMLDLLEEGSGSSDEHGICLSDYACLENWPRHGHPFRNVVAEYLTVARNEGPEVEAGFCAVLTDIVALLCSGTVAHAERYSAARFASVAEVAHG
jgi:hypothetical protein